MGFHIAFLQNLSKSDPFKPDFEMSVCRPYDCFHNLLVGEYRLSENEADTLPC